MLESQIGDLAKYSHHANSSFGIPFDILGLRRKSLLKQEWVSLFLLAPFYTFLNSPKQSLYIVEADCDRPGEGKFLGEFLKPNIVLWVSNAKTHSMNFDRLVKKNKFQTVEEAIAFEFGYFLEFCSKFAVVNGDNPLIMKQIERTKAKVKIIKKDRELKKYQLDQNLTVFQIDGKKYVFQTLLPEEVFYAIAMCRETVEYLDVPFDESFSKFTLPPGRESIFHGIKNTTIIDSSYNANLSSMTAILNMYNKYPSKKKWVVIGDMLEQGESEQEEHEKLADLLIASQLDRIILMGPRVGKYTYPKLVSIRESMAVNKFLGPKETLDYILENIFGGETILFKGARFMEGIIEHLLKDKRDVSKLARREKVWEMRRKQWRL